MRTENEYRRFPRVAATVVVAHLAALIVLAWMHRMPAIVPIVSVVASIAAYVLYASDKRRAQSGQRRVPERVLHVSEFLGGWPGALFAQWWLRHKNRKLSFQLVFWLVVLAHLAAEWLVARR